MARPPLTVICDFDGTITTADIGYAICERFAPGSLERVDARWAAGEISFHEAYRIACLELRAPVAEMVAHALDVAEVRAGFTELVVACRERDAHLVVASAGIDLYVEPILRRHLGPLHDGVEVRANAATATVAGIEVSFPHLHADCATCGNCKGLHARAARHAGHVVIGVGDSHTDACLVREADHVFAREWLASHCDASLIPFRHHEDFHAVARLVHELSDDVGRIPEIA